jgi:hypothetical protein
MEMKKACDLRVRRERKYPGETYEGPETREKARIAERP